MSLTTDRSNSNSPESTESPAADISRRLARRIRSEIQDHDGLLPFDRFMELALYAPGLGYYVAGSRKLGPDGDFVTAPEISPLFGRCIAAQCAEALEHLGGGEILELGAGSGSLAVQILLGLESADALPARYRILEPSPDLRERQQRLIQETVPHLAERCDWLSGLPQGFRGVLVANEVLDAMPVHRFKVGADHQTLEVFVTEHNGDLSETEAPIRSAGLAEAVAALQAEGLANRPGYGSEINLRLRPWLAALSDAIEHGLLLLIDYGYPRSAYYQDDRGMGTLMCHHRHRAHDDPYINLGLQDITAHVDFTAVAEAGVETGFELAGFTTQAHFLIGCGIDQLMMETGNELDLALGAKQLLLPAAMGERFKVLGLSKGVAEHWRGFSVRDLSDRL